MGYMIRIILREFYTILCLGKNWQRFPSLFKGRLLHISREWMLKQATSVVKSTKRSHTCKFTLAKCFTELLPALDKVYWCLLFLPRK